MYRCNHCGNYFEEPEAGEMEPDTGYTPQGCPICGFDDFEEVHMCPICWKNYTTEDFCEECYANVSAGLNKLKEELGATQREFEDIIANHFGW